MRILLIGAVALLSGCAAMPQTATTHGYRGAPVSGLAIVNTDGTFASHAGVWNVADLPAARSAAAERLVAEARSRGYSHLVVTEATTTSWFGQQFRIAGRLFRGSDLPAGASPIGRIDAAIAAAGASFETAGPAVQAKRRPVPGPVVKPVAKPVDEETAPVEEPLVIEAPDFITAVPTRRPVG
jgi:hypothetical protein